MCERHVAMTRTAAFLIYFPVLLLLLPLLSASLARIRLDPSTGRFLDPTTNRTLLFHGVNVVQKKPPWHPSLGAFDAESSLNAGDMANLRAWGFNVVRLGVMWQGVEPVRGQYNATYLSIMRTLVDDLHAHGIYTIVDYHQDVIARKWCGEGVPDWMTSSLEPAETSCSSGVVPWVGKLIGQCKTFASLNISVDNATGYPDSTSCLKVSFDQFSRTPEVTSAWDKFFHNASIQQAFRGYWGAVAAAFAGSPGVLAYDLINEPLNGNYYVDAELLLPGHADLTLLQPMYQQLFQVVQREDPQAVAM